MSPPPAPNRTEDPPPPGALPIPGAPATPPRPPTPLWHRPIPWAIASLVFNPLLLVSAVALIFGALGVRARRRDGERADDEWLGIGLAVAGVAIGATTHLIIGAIAYGGYVGWSVGMLKSGPVELAGYSFREARAQHRTKLVRHGPSPDAAHVTPPPSYATEVTVAGPVGPLEAWLMLPSGDERVPGVVYLHSGFALAESDASTAWSFVAAGYAVLLPSFRGENGNPGDFELCYGELDDARAAILHLAAHPRVEGDRIYVFGHAIGGALAALVALDPGPGVRLTGSVSSLYPPGEFLAWGEEGYVPFRPLADRERDLRSPIRFADQLAVPHFAYLGEDDPLQASLRRLKPALDRAPNLHVETVPGDASGSVLPAVTRFLRRTADPRDFDDRRVLDDLVAAEPARRIAALRALGEVRLPLTPAQTTRMLRLALELDRTAARGAASGPAAAPPHDTPAVPATERRPAALLDAAARSSSPEDLRRIDDSYATLTPSTRSAALRALLEPNDADALSRALRRLIAERDPRVDFPARALRPVRAELLFPRLLQIGPEHPFFLDLLGFTLERCDEVRSAGGAGRPAEALLLPRWESLRERLGSAARARDDGDLEGEDAGAPRLEGGLVLQALGCFDEPSPARLAVLRGAEADPDPLLRFYAVKALLGLEQPVSDATLARVASVDRTRAWLVALLQRRRELERLPHDARTQEALARSHLVGWLAHPLELGRPPAAIETMGTVARPEGVFYVFRYRPRPGHAWLAGVAGPYAAGEITAESPDDVFSELRPASLATPAEHVASTLRTLRDWRESADD